jgi:hypothetical protein
MKNFEQSSEAFEMILEGENSFAIKRIYPDTLSIEEKEKAEKSTPEVILRCFDLEDIKEFQELGEKLAKKQLASINGNKKSKRIFGIF